MALPTTLLFVQVLLAARSLAAPTFPIPSASTSSNISCSSSAPARFISRSTVPDAYDCLATCGDLAMDVSAVMRTAEEGAYDCYCVQSDDVDTSDEVDCAADSWYAYSALPESRAATASAGEGDVGTQGVGVPEPVELGGESSPRLVIQNKRDRKRYIGLCDDGKRPCKVPGQEASYECVDTQTSLTSCGACVAGEYVIGGINATVLGHDCTALPGVAFYGVQCKSGTCIIGACVDGFRLSEGRCVRT